MGVYSGIYSSAFDLGRLSNEQRRELGQHTLTHFPTFATILLHFVTLGIFTLVYFGLKHGRLPIIEGDDFKAWRAIGFMFIPFFNWYWIFRFWLRLVDRVNLQVRLRGNPPPVSKGLMLTAVITSFVVNFLSWAVLFPISIAQIQMASNSLAGSGRETITSV